METFTDVLEENMGANTLSHSFKLVQGKTKIGMGAGEEREILVTN